MLYTNADFENYAKDPAVVQFNGKYFLYHSIMIDGRLNIGISCSEDGENFVRIANLPITQKCEKNGIGAPGCILVKGQIHLFYQTYGNNKLDAICHAVSSDGINFVKDESNPVFAPRMPWAKMPSWSCGRAIDADVCVFGDKMILYFATRDKDFEKQIVGAAWAYLDSDFSAGDFYLHKEPELKPELDWEMTCIEGPASVVIDGKVYMFYAGAYNCSPQQIGCAVSDDGFRFRRLSDQPFLSNGAPGDWNASESGHPYVYETDDGHLWLYYQGSPDMGKSWYLSRRELLFDKGKFILKD